MPHQNVSSSTATAQNQATDQSPPDEQTGRQQGQARPEPRSYAAEDVADASVAPPAAGEMADYMDEGDPLDSSSAQQGRNHNNRPERTEAANDQGAKTTEGNRSRLEDGDAG